VLPLDSQDIPAEDGCKRVQIGVCRQSESYTKRVPGLQGGMSGEYVDEEESVFGST